MTKIIYAYCGGTVFKLILFHLSRIIYVSLNNDIVSGVNVEGILRQAADVDDVERRIREYEQGE